MPSTLNPTCPLCGLRYLNRPLLELHLREDHPQHNRAAEEGSDDHAPHVTNEVIMMTATPRPRRSRSRCARSL